MSANALPAGEPHFFREGDVVMFYYAVDERNVIGPRPATARDKANHAAVYRAFAGEDWAEDAPAPPAEPEAGEYPHLSPAQIEALDRVADGKLKPGGSPKGGNRKARAKKAS